MSTDTLFDKILRREIPADVVYEDEQVLAFRDIQPQAPIHVLVIPKKKVAHFTELAELPVNETGEFFCAVAKVAAHLKLNDNGYRVVLNCGKHGQQSVHYLHAHILGGRQLAWAPG